MDSRGRTSSGGDARVLIVEADAAMGALWSREIGTHISGIQATSAALGDEGIQAACEAADVTVCGAGSTRRDRLAPLEGLMLLKPRGRVILIAAPEAPECVEAGLAAGADDVLLRTPGYLEQLPIAVRTNLFRSRRVSEREAALARLRASVEEVRHENVVLQRLVDRLKAIATTDPLTELANRRGIEERLEQIAAAARRHGSDLSVLMIDLDGLKSINDVLGHQAGDELLRAAARCIREECRRGDVAGRAGGDEFIVLLPHTPAERGALMAERLRARFAALVEPLQNQLTQTRRALGVIRVLGRSGRAEGLLGMTIGVTSLATAGTTTATGLISRADAALYAGKRAGRNRVVVYSPDARERSRAAG